MEALGRVIPFLRKFLNLKDAPVNKWFNCSENQTPSLGNITMIIRFATDLPTIGLDELGTPLVDFIKCNLNLMTKIVPFVKNLNEYQGEYLATAWYLATSRVNKCHNVIFDEIFEIDILTNSKIVRNTYFSTIRLFDNTVWSMIIISMLTISILWSKISIKYNVFQVFWVIFEQLVTESSKILIKLNTIISDCKNFIQEYSLITLITLWLFASLILSSCIKETLLTLYLNQDYEPYINSVSDLYEKNGFNIELMESDFDKFKELLGDKYERLWFKLNFVDIGPPENKLDMIKRISKGEAVFISDSYISQIILNSAPFFRLTLADNRYNHHFISASVTTGHTLSQQIRDGLSRMAMAGLQVRRNMVWSLFSKWYGRIITSAFSNTTRNEFQTELEPIDLNEMGKEMAPVLIIGLTLAVIVFFIEILHNFTSSLKHKKKTKNLKPFKKNQIKVKATEAW